ncbi:outer membrane protein assembly factor BamB family protein [Streptomyces massasporeus]|uniref:outer membrane protein assembly factor BamB family protein n=1 Tax=Streptomyces massasporeus TaxID=67324 RepID=UPI00369518E9
MEELEAGDPRQVGRYRITARLGVGGMGRVYLGRSASGRAVAVKVVRAELADDAAFRVRFAREVEAARRVTGFFTAAVVDADPEGTPAWLATAYVPGISLEDAVRSHGALPMRSVQALGAGLAEALEAIHKVGLIHRDLKPSNVLLAADGPRVIDFGISIAVEASALTQTGMVIGTPGFMSPEHVTGKAIGEPSDVFSLGAVLAFAATGASPFGTGSAHAVNFRAVYEEPDLDGLPAGLDAINWCLAKDPGQRPAVPALITEFAQALGETDAQTAMTHVLTEAGWIPGAAPQTSSDSITAAESPTQVDVAQAGQSPTVPEASHEISQSSVQPGFQFASKTDPSPTARIASSVQSAPVTADTVTRPSRTLSRRKILLASGLAVVITLVFTSWWFFDRGEVRSPKWTFATGGLASSPTIADGTAYVSSYNGNLYAVDASSGKKRWAFNPADYGGLPSAATVSGGIVYVASGEKLYAVDADSGKRRWEFYNAADDLLARPTRPVIDGHTVYIDGGFQSGGELAALDAATGKKRWAFHTGAELAYTPTIANGTIYVVAIKDSSSRLFAIDAETGKKRWEHAGDGLSYSPAVAKGTVYVAGYGHLHALNASTGKQKWSIKVSEYGLTSPIATNGTVYFGSGNSLSAVDATNGKRRWTYVTGDRVLESPAVADGTVYFGSFDDRLYALDATTGKKRWTVQADSNVSSSPVIAEGTLYFGSGSVNESSKGTLYAVEIRSKSEQAAYLRVVHGASQLAHVSPVRMPIAPNALASESEADQGNTGFNRRKPYASPAKASSPAND